MHTLRFLLEQVLSLFENLGPFGPLAFIPFFIVWTTLFLSYPVMLLAAGALFGVWLGFALISISFMIAASGGFLAGRYFSRGWILKKIASNEKMKRLDDLVAQKGWKMVLLLRLSATLPFVLMNYSLGLSKIKFRHYFLASLIGMVPGSLLYVYIGSVAGKMVFDPNRPKNPLEWVLIGLGLAFTITLTIYATMIVKKALKSHD